MSEAEHYQKIDARIAEVNLSLERTKIRRKGGRLTIRATFPPKPGKDNSFKQTDLSPGISASLAGVRAARILAQEIGAQLERGTFTWEPWMKKRDLPAQTVGDWIEKFQEHWQKNTKSKNPDEHWHSHFEQYLKLLPRDQALTYQVLENFVLEYDRASATCYARARAVSPLAKFAGIEQYKTLMRLVNYKPGMRDLPTDAEILEAQALLTNPAWLWVYRMLVVYGLRPHEVFRLDLSKIGQEPGVVYVPQNTKTGFRVVYPCPAGWWEEWKLWEVKKPNVNPDQRTKHLASAVEQHFKRNGISFTPSCLRHCYCIRTAVLGVDPSIAAKWAGHSLKLHEKTYQRWIKEASFTAAWERMKRNEHT